MGITLAYAWSTCKGCNSSYVNLGHGKFVKQRVKLCICSFYEKSEGLGRCHPVVIFKHVVVL